MAVISYRRPNKERMRLLEAEQMMRLQADMASEQAMEKALLGTALGGIGQFAHRQSDEYQQQQELRNAIIKKLMGGAPTSPAAAIQQDLTGRVTLPFDEDGETGPTITSGPIATGERSGLGNGLASLLAAGQAVPGAVWDALMSSGTGPGRSHYKPTPPVARDPLAEALVDDLAAQSLYLESISGEQ